MAGGRFGGDLNSQQRANGGGLRKVRRWRLWDLHRGIHGALLALAFSEEDLRRLLRKAEVAVPGEARFYDIHRHFCDACTTRNRLSEMVEKALEQKASTRTLALRSVRESQALEAKWREAWSKGRGLGAIFWAFLAHPAATEETRAGFYADVHELFYTSMAEREALLTQVETLEHKSFALEKRKREEVAALNARLLKALSAKPAGAEPHQHVEAVAQARKRAEIAELKLARAEARMRTLEERIEALKLRGADKEEVQEPAAPGASQETPPRIVHTAQVTAITRIPGVRIVYVGGRPGVIDHIRDFCTLRGAVFQHHDGGIEQSPVRLTEVLSSADVVFFPVECVSHEAVLHLKAHCKSRNIPLVPLRNASLSTFRSGMRTWCGLS